MAHQESALYELAERLSDTDGGLADSFADILAAALQELIEAVAVVAGMTMVRGIGRAI